MPDRRRQVVLLIAALAAWLPCAAARAADVDLRVSSRQVYVGVPFQIEFTVTNARNYEPPRLPDIPGLRRQLHPPRSSTRTLNDNGLVTHTVSLSYDFVAEREGVIAIPAVTVVVDGNELETVPTRIVATEIPQGPAEASLLFVDVKTEPDTFYLGQTIELALQIWMLPYFDDRYTVRFDTEAMSKHISARASQWGVFRDYLRDISVSEILREDANGTPRAYYVYTVKRTISPNQAGTIGFDDIRVVVDYPTRIRRARSIFGRWETVEARKIAATVDRDPIVIKQPPLEGRPPSFTGAVGRFAMTVTAKPREIAVGDPITLTMTILDRSSPATDLAVLKPPALDSVATMTTDFRVASDQPTGIADRPRRKTFTQTIRAKSDSVTAVPPIPFSFFDPLQKEYVTVASDPISLRVHPATTLSDAQIVSAEGAPAQATTELEVVAGGILANYTGGDLLLSSRAFALTWVHGAAVALGPLAFAIVAVGRTRARRLQKDGGHARRRRARREALRRLSEAQQSPEREANLAAAAVSEYVADRCNLPAGALTGAEVLERLSAGRVASEVLADVETLLADCEQRRYAGGAAADANSIAERARSCIDRLERERLR